jgi:hypothetical protein
MIGYQASVDITTALVRFDTLAGRWTDFTPVLGGRVDVAVRGLLRRQFETEGRAGTGSGWEKLTTRYVDEERKGAAHPILQKDGGLMAALTKRGHGDQELILDPEVYSLTIAEDAETHPRFMGHQYGVPKKNVPVRQPIPDPLPKTFIREMQQIVRSYVVYGKK